MKFDTVSSVPGRRPRRHIGIDIRKMGLVARRQSGDCAFIGPQPKAFFQGVEIVLDYPGRVEEVFFPGETIFVFNDAPYRDGRQRHYLGCKLAFAVPGDQFFERLVFRIYNTAIRMDGPRLDARHGIIRRHRNFHIPKNLAFLTQYLDAVIDKLLSADVIPIVCVVEL